MLYSTIEGELELKLNDKVVFRFWTRRLLSERALGPWLRAELRSHIYWGIGITTFFKKSKRVHMNVGVKNKSKPLLLQNIFQKLRRVFKTKPTLFAACPPRHTNQSTFTHMLPR